jgi:signal transduction histidine kinase
MPTSSLNSERRALAEWLDEDRRQIVAEWVKGIQEDPEIPDADHLTLAALQDHFPEMIDEFIEGLRDPTHLLDAGTREVGLAHGQRRWRHQYRLDEMLRELARVREILLDHIRRFCEEHHFSALREDASAKVRRFFDVVVALSAQQFMHEQASELTLRSAQLEDARRQIREAGDQLRAVAESRFRMLHGVSHELRNAFQEVNLGATNLLQEGGTEEQNEIAAAVARNATHLQRTLDRLQQFSSILAGESSLRVEALDLSDFLAEVEKAHQPAAERKGLKFHRAEEIDPAWVKTDHEKLRHIADILVSNALEYTKRGTIGVVIGVAENERWTLRVVDTGIGIHKDDAKMVFHEFHRTPRTAERGVGLGLIIARYLAHLMHGEITFESQHGQGSQFEVRLPRDLSAFAA